MADTALSPADADTLKQARPAQGWPRLAVLAEWWRPLLTAIGLCVLVLVTKPSGDIDRRLSDQLLVHKRTAPDARITIVELDAEALRRYGGPPIDRTALAMLLERIEKGGATRVLLDVALTEPLHKVPDARLAAAITALGPDRLGLVSSPGPRDLPAPVFAPLATIVDARLTPDVDGWHRRIGNPGNTVGANAARWLASGKSDSTYIPLDIRVATARFSRISAVDVIDGAGDFDGKLVVISANTAIAPSRAFLPMTTRADRASVFALGAQSVRSGHEQQRARGLTASMALQILAVTLGFLCAAAAHSSRRLIVLVSTSAVVLFTTCLSLASTYAVEIAPVGLLSTFAVMVNVTLVQRLKIMPMMRSFLKGDVSPDEAWAWRSCENSVNPAMLLSADGRVKRSNAPADELIRLTGLVLAARCLPRIGERGNELSVDLPDGQVRIFQIDWPYPNLAIAVLRDTTDDEEERRVLHEQLSTDELTGHANRRGFDYALKQAADDEFGYTVFFLDMNGFKAVNDTWGHGAGDELLMVTARRIAAQVRPEDTVARLGGDEFAILTAAPLTDQGAAHMKTRLAEAIAIPVELSGAGARALVGAAIGHATPNFTGEDPAVVVRRADQAMYRDKAESKMRLVA